MWKYRRTIPTILYAGIRRGAALSLVPVKRFNNCIGYSDTLKDYHLQAVNSIYEDSLQQMAAEEQQDASNQDSDDDSDEEGQVNAVASRTKTYKLKDFCVTRWYSAWLVMNRFYSLLEALDALVREMEEDESFYKGPKRATFINTLRSIDEGELRRALHFLYPLVQGIDYCQYDQSLQIDIAPMIDAIKEFYMEHSLGSGDSTASTILPIPREDIAKAFDKRRSLFFTLPKVIRDFFCDAYFKSREDGTVDETEAELQQYVRTVCDGIVEYVLTTECVPKEIVTAIAKNTPKLFEEVKKFVLEKKYRLSLFSFMKTSTALYPLLSPLYEYLYSQPASSAAVERSFSVQNSIMVPSRNRLSVYLSGKLLFIKMNYFAATKYQWEDDLMKHLYFLASDTNYSERNNNRV